MSANTSEEPPPYLPVGTEVSAKFKGAFCEAKVKRVDKQVKCKITLKSNNEQYTVSDTALRTVNGQLLTCNDFKLGGVIYVSKTNPNNDFNKNEQISPDHLQAAILNKVTDYSHYTVVFNDGDEKANMKRSLIRFKGEKHYLDSETLNNAPLNNPEHFLYPIKNQNNKLSPTGNDTKQNLSDNESDMTSIAGGDEELAKKKSKTDETKNEEEDDGEESDCSSTSSSDDYPAEEKDRFVAQLFKFMDDRGTPMNKVPSINKIDLDLHKFFIIVRKFGGYNKVVKQRCWSDIYKRLGLPNPNVSNIINLKSAYERYLQAYEDFFRKLGSSMCDLISLRQSNSTAASKRSSTADSSHRSLFKNRYLTPTTTNSQKKPVATKSKKQKANPNSSTANEAPSSPTSSMQRSILETPKPKRTSIDEITDDTSNKEFTIESLVSNNLMGSAASNSSIDEQQQPEELTLFSMFRNIEDSKKARKQEEEKKKKEKKLEEQQQTDYSSDNEKRDSLKASASKEDIKSQSKNSTTSNQAQKRPLPVQTSKQKGTRSSTEKINIKTDSKVKLESKDEEQEDDGEPKAKKKASSRLSTGDDMSSLKSNGLKRKISISKTLADGNDDIENNKDTSSQDGTNDNQINESSMSIDLNENNETNFTYNDIEVNSVLDVKYGNTNQLYRAKVVQLNPENQTIMVHYSGWNNRYDEYIKMDRVIRIIDTESSLQKRRKTKNSSNQSTSSENQASSSTSINSKESKTNELASSSSSSSSSSKQTKNIMTQKITKRSSSSTTSSYSSTDQPLLSKEESNAPESKQTKAISASATEKTTSKLRNSDSISSSSSINSLKRQSSEEIEKKSSLSSSTSSTSSVLPLITSTSIPNTIEIKHLDNTSSQIKLEKETANKFQLKEDKSKLSSEVNDKKAEKLLDSNFSLNPLLSIKEEIIEEIKREPSTLNNLVDNIQTDKITNTQITISRRSSINAKENELNSPKIAIPKSENSTTELNSPKERSSSKASLNDEKLQTDLVKKSPSSLNVNTSGSKTPSSKNESKSSKQKEIHKELQNETENKTLANEPANLSKVLENQSESNLIASENCSSKITTNKTNEKSKQIEVNNSLDSTSKENDHIIEIICEREAKKLDTSSENLQSKQHLDLNNKLTNAPKNVSSSVLVSSNEDNVLNSIINSKKNDVFINNTSIDSKYSFHIISVNLVGKQKIKYIEDQMRLCREAYAKLKNEIASIDRKKKKLKRNHLEKSNLANTGDEC